MSGNRVNPNKRQRARYREALARAQMIRPDRLTELVQAVKAGGSCPCRCCGIVHPANELSERGICDYCSRALGKVRVNLPAVRYHDLATDEPGVVYVDASYRDGVAGLAIVGALGQHSRRIEAVSSTQAETLALGWAI